MGTEDRAEYDDGRSFDPAVVARFRAAMGNPHGYNDNRGLSRIDDDAQLERWRTQMAVDPSRVWTDPETGIRYVEGENVTPEWQAQDSASGLGEMNQWGPAAAALLVGGGLAANAGLFGGAGLEGGTFDFGEFLANNPAASYADGATGTLAELGESAYATGDSFLDGIASSLEGTGTDLTGGQLTNLEQIAADAGSNFGMNPDVLSTTFGPGAFESLEAPSWLDQLTRRVGDLGGSIVDRLPAIASAIRPALASQATRGGAGGLGGFGGGAGSGSAGNLRAGRVDPEENPYARVKKLQEVGNLMSYIGGSGGHA